MAERRRGFRASRRSRSCYHQGIKPRSWIAEDLEEDNGNDSSPGIRMERTFRGARNGKRKKEGQSTKGMPVAYSALMNEATRKLKWQLRNIISSAVKRVSQELCQGIRTFHPPNNKRCQLQRVSLSSSSLSLCLSSRLDPRLSYLSSEPTLRVTEKLSLFHREEVIW